MKAKTEEIPTKAANEEILKIKRSDDLTQILDGMTRPISRFMEDVEFYMDKKKIKRSKLAIEVSPVMSPSHLYSLLNGNRLPGKREYVIAIGLGLKLSVDELTKLLKDSGHRGLDANRSMGDVIVLYGITHHLSIDDINEMLHSKEADYVLYEL